MFSGAPVVIFAGAPAVLAVGEPGSGPELLIGSPQFQPLIVVPTLQKITLCVPDWLVSMIVSPTEAVTGLIAVTELPDLEAVTLLLTKKQWVPSGIAVLHAAIDVSLAVMAMVAARTGGANPAVVAIIATAATRGSVLFMSLGNLGNFP
ncbi:MAG: hypothetical protein ACKO1X_04505 [Acidimicrobiales bacterium]